MVRKTPTTAPRSLAVVPDGDLPDLGEPTAAGGPSGAEGPVDLPDLGAAGQPSAGTPFTAADVLAWLPLPSVVPSEANPRADLGVDEDFVASIREHGVIQPIVVTDNGDGSYALVAGHRRLAAAALAGLESIPAVVRSGALVDASTEAVRLVENLQRRDLTPTEEARAYKRLIDVHGMTQAAVSVAVSRNQGHVSKRIKMLALGDVGLALVDSGVLNLEDATDLARMPAVVRDHAIDQVANGANPEFSVGNARRKVEELAERGAAIKEVKASGVAWVDLGKPGAALPEGAATVGWYAKGVDRVAESPEAHKDCPARLVVVLKSKEWVNGAMSWTADVCSDASLHPGAGSPTSESPDDDAPGAEHAAERAALVAAATARGEALAARADVRADFVSSVLRGKLPRSTAEFVYRCASIEPFVDEVLDYSDHPGEIAMMVCPTELLVGDSEQSLRDAAARWSAQAILDGKTDVLLRLAAARYCYGVLSAITAGIAFRNSYGMAPLIRVGLGWLAAVGLDLDADETVLAEAVSDRSLSDSLLLACGLLPEPAEDEVADGNDGDDSSE